MITVTSKISWGYRGISLLMAFIFMATSIVSNPSEARAFAESRDVSGQQGFEDAFQRFLYSLSPEIGSVTSVERFSDPASVKPFVVHIEDAHANPEAQRNIGAILKFLAQKYPDLVIAIEGASGPIHPEYLQFFREFPEAGQAVAEDLLQKGELSGAELFAWSGYQAKSRGFQSLEAQKNERSELEVRFPQVRGVESVPLYRENLKTYRELLFRRDEIRTHLNPLHAKLDTNASRVLNADLREFLKERSRRKEGRYAPGHGSGDPELQVYVHTLNKQALKVLKIDLKDPIEQLRFPNLVRILLAETAQKSFDREKAAKDWTDVLALIKAAGKGPEGQSLYQALEAFGRENGLVESKEGGMPVAKSFEPALYPRRLLEEAFLFSKRHSLSFSGHQAFLKSMEGLILRAEVEVTGLLQEMEALETLLIDNLARTEVEKRMVQRLQSFDLFEKLLSLELTREEYRQVVADRGAMAAFVKDVPGLEGALAHAYQFYETTLRRERALVENALKLKSEPKDVPGPSQVIVLITGGFHSEGIEEILREQGVSYASLEPHIHRTDRGELYQKVMADENADLSAYFKVKNPFLTKQEAVFFKEMIEIATPSLFEKYGVEPSLIVTLVDQAVKRHPILSGALEAHSSAEDKVTTLRLIPRTPVPQNMTIAAPAITAEPSFQGNLAGDHPIRGIPSAATIDFGVAAALTMSIRSVPLPVLVAHSMLRAEVREDTPKRARDEAQTVKSSSLSSMQNKTGLLSLFEGSRSRSEMRGQEFSERNGTGSSGREREPKEVASKRLQEAIEKWAASLRLSPQEKNQSRQVVLILDGEGYVSEVQSSENIEDWSRFPLGGYQSRISLNTGKLRLVQYHAGAESISLDRLAINEDAKNIYNSKAQGWLGENMRSEVRGAVESGKHGRWTFSSNSEHWRDHASRIRLKLEAWSQILPRLIQAYFYQEVDGMPISDSETLRKDGDGLRIMRRQFGWEHEVGRAHVHFSRESGRLVLEIEDQISPLQKELRSQLRSFIRAAMPEDAILVSTIAHVPTLVVLARKVPEDLKSPTLRDALKTYDGVPSKSVFADPVFGLQPHRDLDQWNSGPPPIGSLLYDIWVSRSFGWLMNMGRLATLRKNQLALLEELSLLPLNADSLKRAWSMDQLRRTTIGRNLATFGSELWLQYNKENHYLGMCASRKALQGQERVRSEMREERPLRNEKLEIQEGGILAVRDLGVWDFARISLEGDLNYYFIGFVEQSQRLLANLRLWRSLHPEASGDSNCLLLENAISSLIAQGHRQILLFYEPFDQGGFLRYHEGMHLAMDLRAQRTTAGRVEESRLVALEKTINGLDNTVREHRAVQRAFQDVKESLLRYPPARLSGEWFAWIAELSEYPGARARFKSWEPKDSQELQFLFHYFGQEKTTTVVMEPFRRFIEAMLQVPSLVRFFSDYYTELLSAVPELNLAVPRVFRQSAPVTGETGSARSEMREGDLVNAVAGRGQPSSYVVKEKATGFSIRQEGNHVRIISSKATTAPGTTDFLRFNALMSFIPLWFFRSVLKQKTYAQLFRSLKAMRPPPRHFLIILGLEPNEGFLGDSVVLHTPLLRVLRKLFPTARLTIVTNRSDFWEIEDPSIQWIERQEFDKLGDTDVGQMGKNISWLRQAIGADTLLNLTSSNAPAWTQALTTAFPDASIFMNQGFGGVWHSGGHAERIFRQPLAWEMGFDFAAFGKNLPQRMHQFYEEATGDPWTEDSSWFLHETENDRTNLETVLPSDGRPVWYFNPFSSKNVRNWLDINELTDFIHLALREPVRPRIILFQPRDPTQERILKGILERLSSEEKRSVVQVTGATLHDVKVLLSRVDLVISVDTGIPHLAAALGKPSIILMFAEPFNGLKLLKRLTRTDLRWLPAPDMLQNGDYLVSWRPNHFSPQRVLEKIHAWTQRQSRKAESVTASEPSRFDRRWLDLGVSLFFMVAASPLVLCAALLVAATRSGPVIFRQTRLGLHETLFTIFKFRTLDNKGQEIRLGRFPLGDWLRRTRIDELPQLWNILRGEMAVFGARPISLGDVALLAEHCSGLIDELRHEVWVRKPGLISLYTASLGDDTSAHKGRDRTIQIFSRLAKVTAEENARWSSGLLAYEIYRTVKLLIHGFFRVSTERSPASEPKRQKSLSIPAARSEVREGARRAAETFINLKYDPFLQDRFLRGHEGRRPAEIREALEEALHASGLSLDELFSKYKHLSAIFSGSILSTTQAFYLNEVLNEELFIPQGLVFVFNEQMTEGGGYAYLAVPARISDQGVVHMELPDGRHYEKPYLVIDDLNPAEAGRLTRVLTWAAMNIPTRIYIFDERLREKEQRYLGRLGDIERTLGVLPDTDGITVESLIQETNSDPWTRQFLTRLWIETSRRRHELKRFFLRGYLIHEGTHALLEFLIGNPVNFLSWMNDKPLETLQSMIEGDEAKQREALDAKAKLLFNPATSLLWRKYSEVSSIREKSQWLSIGEEAMNFLTEFLEGPLASDVIESRLGNVLDTEKLPDYRVVDSHLAAADFIIRDFREHEKGKSSSASNKECSIFLLSRPNAGRRLARELRAREFNPGLFASHSIVSASPQAAQPPFSSRSEVREERETPGVPTSPVTGPRIATRQARQALSFLVSRPADFDWEANAKTLPGLKGVVIPLDAQGRISLTVGPSQYQPPLLGMTESGWEMVILEAGVRDGAYFFEAEFRKKDRPSFTKMFQVGPHRRPLKLRGGTQTEEAPVVFEILERPGFYTLHELVMKASDYDWVKNPDHVLPFKRILLGKPAPVNGNYTFYPVPGDTSYGYSLGFKAYADRVGYLIDGGVKDGVYRFGISLEKPGADPKVFHFQVSPDPIMLKSHSGRPDVEVRSLSQRAALRPLARIIENISNRIPVEERDIALLPGLKIGPLDHYGAVRFYHINAKYIWSLLGFYPAQGENWVATVTAAERVPAGVRLVIRLENGKRTFEKIFHIESVADAAKDLRSENSGYDPNIFYFQVSPVPRELKAKAGRPEIEGRSLTRRAALPPLAEILESITDKTAVDEREIALLEGLRMGPLDRQGAVKFRSAHYHFTFPVLGVLPKPGKQWMATVVAAHRVNWGLQLEVRLEDGKNTLFRRFQIEPVTHLTSGATEGVGFKESAYDPKIIYLQMSPNPKTLTEDAERPNVESRILSSRAALRPLGRILEAVSENAAVDDEDVESLPGLRIGPLSRYGAVSLHLHNYRYIWAVLGSLPKPGEKWMATVIAAHRVNGWIQFVVHLEDGVDNFYKAFQIGPVTRSVAGIFDQKGLWKEMPAMIDLDTIGTFSLPDSPMAEIRWIGGKAVFVKTQLDPYWYTYRHEFYLRLTKVLNSLENGITREIANKILQGSEDALIAGSMNNVSPDLIRTVRETLKQGMAGFKLEKIPQQPEGPAEGAGAAREDHPLTPPKANGRSEVRNEKRGGRIIPERYDAAWLASDQRTPASILAARPEFVRFRDWLRHPRADERIAEWMKNYLYAGKLYSEIVRFPDEDARAFDEAGRAFIALADSGDAEARLFLWKLGEIAANLAFREGAVKPYELTIGGRRWNYRTRFADSPTPQLPHLELAAGPNAVAFMQELVGVRDRFVFIDRSFFVEAMLNRAKKLWRLGNNIEILRADVKDLDRVFPEKAYRSIRLCNVEEYVDGFPEDAFVTRMLEKVHGFIQMEHVYAGRAESAEEVLRSSRTLAAIRAKSGAAWKETYVPVAPVREAEVSPLGRHYRIVFAFDRIGPVPSWQSQTKVADGNKRSEVREVTPAAPANALRIFHEKFLADTEPERHFIQSFSGFRVMNTPNENHLLAFSIYAYLHGLEVIDHHPNASSVYSFSIARDPRPSSEAIATAQMRGYLLAGLERGVKIRIDDMGIVTTPMAEEGVRSFQDHGRGSEGGAIVTASHNPLEQNGGKFLTGESAEEGEGAILPEERVNPLIAQFARIRLSPEELFHLKSEFDSNRVNEALAAQRRFAVESLGWFGRGLLLCGGLGEKIGVWVVRWRRQREVRKNYLEFIRRLFKDKGFEYLKDFAIGLHPNGGAATGHVRWVFEHLGFKPLEIKSSLGRPIDPIEPKEGSPGLKRLTRFLAKHGISIGIMFDFDADRGTTAPEMEPQAVAAFNVAAALMWMDAYKLAEDREVVIIAHEATSMWVEAIAKLFSRPDRPVRVRRVETGETNVVTAMREERNAGRFAPIGVEGANGGTVFMESTCRDGVVTGILTALALKDPNMHRVWKETLARAGLNEESWSLEGLLRSLPDQDHISPLGKKDMTGDTKELTGEMEARFKDLWNDDTRNKELKRLYESWHVRYYEGTKEKEVPTDGLNGGWVLYLKRHDGSQDFLRIRASKTQPYLSYVIDVRHQQDLSLLEGTFDAIFGPSTPAFPRSEVREEAPATTGNKQRLPSGKIGTSKYLKQYERVVGFLEAIQSLDHEDVRYQQAMAELQLWQMGLSANAYPATMGRRMNRPAQIMVGHADLLYPRYRRALREVFASWIRGGRFEAAEILRFASLRAESVRADKLKALIESIDSQLKPQTSVAQAAAAAREYRQQVSDWEAEGGGPALEPDKVRSEVQVRSESREGGPATSLIISRRQLDGLFREKSKERTWAFIRDLLSPHQDEISKGILKALFLSVVPATLSQSNAEALVANYLQRADLSSMDAFIFALNYGVLTHIVENMIDSYLQRQYEDPRYQKELKIDFYALTSGTNLTLRLVANGMPLSRAWVSEEKRQHPDIQVGGAGVASSVSSIAARLSHFEVDAVQDRETAIRDGESGAVVDVHFPLSLIFLIADIFGRLEDELRDAGRTGEVAPAGTSPFDQLPAMRSFDSPPNAKRKTRLRVAQEAIEAGLGESTLKEVLRLAASSDAQGGRLNGGRSLVLPLGKSAWIRKKGRTFKALLLKAVRIESQDGPIAPFVAKPSDRATQPGMELWADAQGVYNVRSHAPSPQGGATLEQMEAEYLRYREAFFHDLTGFPVGIGEFPDLRFQGQRIGFLVVAVEDAADERIAFRVYGQIPLVNRSKGFEKKKQITRILKELAEGISAGSRTLRKLHQTGTLHTGAHVGNYTVPMNGISYARDFGGSHSVRGMTRAQYAAFVVKDFVSMAINAYAVWDPKDADDLYQPELLGIRPTPLERVALDYLSPEEVLRIGRERLLRAMGRDEIGYLKDLLEHPGRLAGKRPQDFPSEIIKIIVPIAEADYDQALVAASASPETLETAVPRSEARSQNGEASRPSDIRGPGQIEEPAQSDAGEYHRAFDRIVRLLENIQSNKPENDLYQRTMAALLAWQTGLGEEANPPKIGRRVNRPAQIIVGHANRLYPRYRKALKEVFAFWIHAGRFETAEILRSASLQAEGVRADKLKSLIESIDSQLSPQTSVGQAASTALEYRRKVGDWESEGGALARGSWVLQEKPRSEVRENGQPAGAVRLPPGFDRGVPVFADKADRILWHVENGVPYATPAEETHAFVSFWDTARQQRSLWPFLSALAPNAPRPGSNVSETQRAATANAAKKVLAFYGAQLYGELRQILGNQEALTRWKFKRAAGLIEAAGIKPELRRAYFFLYFVLLSAVRDVTETVDNNSVVEEMSVWASRDNLLNLEDVQKYVSVSRRMLQTQGQTYPTLVGPSLKMLAAGFLDELPPSERDHAASVIEKVYFQIEKEHRLSPAVRAYHRILQFASIVKGNFKAADLHAPAVQNRLLSRRGFEAYRVIKSWLTDHGFNGLPLDYDWGAADLGTALYLSDGDIHIRDGLPFGFGVSSATVDPLLKEEYLRIKGVFGFMKTRYLWLIGQAKAPILWELEALGVDPETVRITREPESHHRYKIQFEWAADGNRLHAKPRQVIYEEKIFDEDLARQGILHRHPDSLYLRKADLSHTGPLNTDAAVAISFGPAQAPPGYRAFAIRQLPGYVPVYEDAAEAPYANPDRGFVYVRQAAPGVAAIVAADPAAIRQIVQRTIGGRRPPGVSERLYGLFVARTVQRVMTQGLSEDSVVSDFARQEYDHEFRSEVRQSESGEAPSLNATRAQTGGMGRAETREAGKLWCDSIDWQKVFAVRVAKEIQKNGGDPSAVIRALTRAIGAQVFDNPKGFAQFLRGSNLKYLGVKTLPAWLADDTFAALRYTAEQPVEGEEGLVAHSVAGSRDIDLSYDPELVRRLGPQVIEAIERIAAYYPNEWHRGDYTKVSGRTVVIDLKRSLRVGDREGDQIEVSGTVFNPADIGRDFMEMHIASRGVSAAEVSQKELKGATDPSVDASGRPILEPKTLWAQQGGYFYPGARRKFENSRNLLPRHGLRGPIAVGFGKYRTLKKNGVPLGVVILLTRKDAHRFGSEISHRFRLLQDWASRTGLRQGFLRVEDLTAKMKELKLDQAYIRYGRELRSIIDKDLYPGSPHTGNMEVDLDGNQPTTWYDVGNWKSGEGMTEYQKFGHVYLVLAYAMSVIQRDLSEETMMRDMFQSKTWDPYHDFLRGFFYDRLSDPLFNVKDLTFYRTEDDHIYTGIQFVAHNDQYRDRPQEVPPLAERLDAPFVPLLRAIRGLDHPDGLPASPRSEVRGDALAAVPFTDWVNRVLSRFPNGDIKEETLKAQDEALIRKNPIVGFLWYMVHLSGFLVEDIDREIRGPSGDWLHADIFFEQYYGRSKTGAQWEQVRIYLKNLRLSKMPGQPASLISPDLNVRLPIGNATPRFEVMETSSGTRQPERRRAEVRDEPSRIEKAAAAYARVFKEERDRQTFVGRVVKGDLEGARTLVAQRGLTHYESYQMEPTRAVYPGGLDLKIFDLFPNLETAHFINLRPFRVAYDVAKLRFREYDPNGVLRILEGPQAFDAMMERYLLGTGEEPFLGDGPQKRIVYADEESEENDVPQIGMEPFLRADLERKGATHIRVTAWEAPRPGVKVFEIRFNDLLGRSRAIYYHQMDFLEKGYAKILSDDLHAKRIGLFFMKGFTPNVSGRATFSPLEHDLLYPREIYDGLADNALLVRDAPLHSFLRGVFDQGQLTVKSDRAASFKFEHLGDLGGLGTPWGELGHHRVGNNAFLEVFRLRKERILGEAETPDASLAALASLLGVSSVGRSELRGPTLAAKEQLVVSNGSFILKTRAFPQDAVIEVATTVTEGVFSEPGIASYLPVQVPVFVNGRAGTLTPRDAARSFIVWQVTRQVIENASVSGISNERLMGVMETLQKVLPAGVMLPSGSALKGPRIHVDLTGLTEKDWSSLLPNFAVVIGALVTLHGTLVINVSAEGKALQGIEGKIRDLAKGEGLALASNQLKLVTRRQDDPFSLKGIQEVDALAARSLESFDTVHYRKGIGSRWMTDDAGDMKVLAAALTTVLYAAVDKSRETDRFNIHKPSEYDHGALLATVLQAIQGYLQIRTAA